MFGKKEKKNQNVTEEMNQFAVMIPGGVSTTTCVEALNKWCYENNCIPLNFKIEDAPLSLKYVLALVKRI